MSSSRPSSPRRSRAQRNRCPSCGQRSMVSVEEPVVLHVGRRRYPFERVAHERCLTCGERIFGIEASQLFDRVVLKGRRRHAA